MNTRSLMDQLLKSGSEFLNKQSGGQSKTHDASDALSSLLSSARGGKGNGSDALSSLLSGAGGGALGAGALALLMGNKKVRKVGGNVAMYGGLAALGVVAYKAYDNWQKTQAEQAGTTTQTTFREPQTVDRLSGAQAEEHSNAILRALIGAAKADGHVDDKERELIDGEIAKISSDAQLKQWFDKELRKPLDPSEIASSARSPEMAAEMYLASLLVVDEKNFMEKAYLEELGRQLKLAPSLITELEQQASRALSGNI
jgi:uncharacterized membrane protein YebE (DUF533 family)